LRYAALDTNALIWAMKDECTPGQEDMKRRARLALREIERSKLGIVIPSIALAELVSPMSDRQAGDFIAAAEEQFLIAPFDARAASVAAKLWREHKKFPESEKLKRSILKADALIIASAHCAGAAVFYSHDRACRKLASTLMDGRDLPDHAEELFDEVNEVPPTA
jgi:predicted nucleic acid-binding protein